MWMRRRRCNINTRQLNSDHSSFSVFSHEYKDVNRRSPHGVPAERANGLHAHENYAKELSEREMDWDLLSWVHPPLSPSLPSSSPRELLKHHGVLTALSPLHPPFDVSKKSLQWAYPTRKDPMAVTPNYASTKKEGTRGVERVARWAAHNSTRVPLLCLCSNSCFFQ